MSSLSVIYFITGPLRTEWDRLVMKNDKEPQMLHTLVGDYWCTVGASRGKCSIKPRVGDGGVVEIRKDFTEELLLTGRGFKKLIQLFAY